MVIVDSTVWIDYFRGDSNQHVAWLESRLTAQPLGLTDLILCEILQGIRSESEFSDTRRSLTNFHVFDSGSSDVAIAAARNYRLLRAKGITVRKTIDCLIATFCIEEDHVLLHRDRDFDHFEKYLGLRVLHP